MVSVHVAELLKSLPGTTRPFELSEPIEDPRGDLELLSPVSGTVTLTRTSSGILASSEHKATVALECARCLDSISAEVAASFEEEFLPTVEITTGAPIRDDDGPAADQPRIAETHEIHLDDLLRQSLLTSLPLRPLCSPDCPGLCPECGERQDARHRPHPVDPGEVVEVPPSNPFAQLKHLLDEAEELDKR